MRRWPGPRTGPARSSCSSPRSTAARTCCSRARRGPGKSTLLRSVASERAAPFHLVEGNAELTPARLVGHFDPAQVLARGYTPDVFVDGPLVVALRDGGLLYVEEINRVPEETLNVLITVMSESELTVPRLGPGARRAGLPAGRGDEPVRRGRHRADLLGDLRPDLPDLDGLPVRRRPSRTSSRCGPPRCDAGWRARVVDLVRRTRVAPGRPDRLLGARRDRPGRDRQPARRDARRCRRTTGTPGSTRRWCRCRAGSGCTSPRGAGPRRSCASSTRRCSAPTVPTTPDAAGRDRPGGSLSPPGAGRPQQRRNPKADAARNRTVGRSTLSRHARFAELSPEVGVLDEQALDRALAADPDATLALVADLVHATDESAARAGPPARRPAGHRPVPVRASARAPVRRSRGSSPPSSGGDLDVDASLEGILTARGERRPADLDDLTARDWGRQDLARVPARRRLRVDERRAARGRRHGGRGLRAAGAGAARACSPSPATCACCDRCTAPSRAATVVDRVLALRGHGVTRLADALRAGVEQLTAARAQRRVVVLLSDCRHTDEDPVRVGRGGAGAGGARPARATPSRRRRSPRRPAPGGPSSPARTARRRCCASCCRRGRCGRGRRRPQRRVPAGVQAASATSRRGRRVRAVPARHDGRGQRRRLDAEHLGQAVGQPPVPPAEHADQGGDEQRPHQGRVDEDADAERGAEHLDVGARARRPARRTRRTGSAPPR